MKKVLKLKFWASLHFTFLKYFDPFFSNEDVKIPTVQGKQT